MVRRIGETSLVTPVVMMLILLGHAQPRGLDVLADDGDVWDAAVVLVALAGPLAGARLLLEPGDR